MKNIIRFAVALVTIVTMTTTPVMAATIEPASIIGTVVQAAGDAYDASVVARMAGRSGSAAAPGAKGIAFEVMYADKKNLSNVFKKGVKTVLTKNSQATQVDLVTLYDDGSKVMERLQLKDVQSDTGIRDIINRVKSSDYRAARLVGTSETAEAYNAKAAANGVTKVMADSGISTETTQMVANKALGNAPTVAQAAKSITTITKSYMAIGAVINLGESIIEGDDAADTIANTTVGTAQSGVTGLAAGGAEALATTGLAVAGVTNPVALFIIPVGAMIITGYITDTMLEGVADIAQENLSAALHTAQDVAEEKAEYIAVAIDESGVIDQAAATASTAATTTAQVATTAASAVAEGASTIKDTLTKQ